MGFWDTLKNVGLTVATGGIAPASAYIAAKAAGASDGQIVDTAKNAAPYAGAGLGFVAGGPAGAMLGYSAGQLVKSGIGQLQGTDGGDAATPGAAPVPVSLGSVAPTVISASAPMVDPNAGSGNRIGGEAAAQPSQVQQLYAQQLQQAQRAHDAAAAGIAAQQPQLTQAQAALARAQAAANVTEIAKQLQALQTTAQTNGIGGSIALSHIAPMQQALNKAMASAGITDPSQAVALAATVPALTEQVQKSQAQLQQLQAQQQSAAAAVQQTGAQFHGQVVKDDSDPARLANMQQAVQDRQGPTLDRATIDPTAGNADMSRYLDDRGQVSSLAGALGQTAYGTGGPSVAEQQMQVGNQAAMNNALSIANSQRGGGGTLGTLEALRSNAVNTASSNQQQGILRAQEQLNARTTLGNVLNAQGSSDLAARNATMGQANTVGQFDASQNSTAYQGALQARAQNDAQSNAYLNAYMDSTGRPLSIATANQGAALNTQGQVINANVAYAGQAAGQNQAQLSSGTNLATTQMTIDQQNAQLAEQKRLADQNRTDKNTSALVGGTSTYLAANATTGGGAAPSPTPSSGASPYTDNTIVDPWHTT